MKKNLKSVLYVLLYAVVAFLFTMLMMYCYEKFPQFKALFEGAVSTPLEKGSAVQQANQAIQSAKSAGMISFVIFIFVFCLQIFAFLTALLVYNGLRNSRESVKVRLSKMENAEIFLDLPLYFGLFGTVSSFVLMNFNPQISRLIAYSSTLVGIIISVILRLGLQYPLKQKLSELSDRTVKK